MDHARPGCIKGAGPRDTPHHHLPTDAHRAMAGPIPYVVDTNAPAKTHPGSRHIYRLQCHMLRDGPTSRSCDRDY